MPPDPFADDPNDPARALEGPHDGLDRAAHRGDGDTEPPGAPLLDADEEAAAEQERLELLEDLSDLAVYQALLEPRGVRGVVVDCGDCEQPHFHDWELLRASLEQLLEVGQTRPHEPAYDPDPADYVTWEYCRGYADGVNATEATENAR